MGQSSAFYARDIFWRYEENSKNYFIRGINGMNRLFVLGNGFDLKHGLKTSYEHFKEYLKKQYQYIDNFENCIPSQYDRNEISTFIIDLITKGSKETLWKDIEAAIGYADEYVVDYIKDSLDYDIQKIYGALLGTALEKIPLFFSEWVNTIDISDTSINTQFYDLINPYEDAFLSFNYTNVLEDIYGLNGVCHIHGRQHNRLVFGHGHDITYRTEYLLREDLESGLLEAYLDLRKNTTAQIEAHKDFFDRVNFLKSIYSYGFSFSEPDMPYIKEICKGTDRDTTWFLSNFEDESTRELYKKKIRENGFVGSFGIFSLD